MQFVFFIFLYYTGADLANFEVSVYSSDPLTTPGASSEMCVQYPGALTDGQVVLLPCVQPTVGQVVRVTNGHSATLNLCICEIEVFAAEHP